MSNQYNETKWKVYLPVAMTALLGVALLVVGIVLLAS